MSSFSECELTSWPYGSWPNLWVVGVFIHKRINSTCFSMKFDLKWNNLYNLKLRIIKDKSTLVWSPIMYYFHYFQITPVSGKDKTILIFIKKNIRICNTHSYIFSHLPSTPLSLLNFFIKHICRYYYEPGTKLYTKDTKIIKAYHAPANISQDNVRHMIF